MINRNKNDNGYFDHIPTEIFRQIANHLTPKDLENLSLTNNTLNTLVKIARPKDFNGNFDFLPKEIFQMIVDQLSLKNLKNLSRTNKKLHKIVNKSTPKYFKGTYKEIYSHIIVINDTTRALNSVKAENKMLEKNKYAITFAIAMLNVLSGLITYLISRNEPSDTILAHLITSMFATSAVCGLAVVFYAQSHHDKSAKISQEQQEHKLEMYRLMNDDYHIEDTESEDEESSVNHQAQEDHEEQEDEEDQEEQRPLMRK